MTRLDFVQLRLAAARLYWRGAGGGFHGCLVPTDGKEQTLEGASRSERPLTVESWSSSSQKGPIPSMFGKESHRYHLPTHCFTRAAGAVQKRLLVPANVVGGPAWMAAKVVYFQQLVEGEEFRGAPAALSKALPSSSSPAGPHSSSWQHVMKKEEGVCACGEPVAELIPRAGKYQ